VAGHVELRHDADAAGTGIGDDVFGLLLRVEEAIGAFRRELGEELAY
jgi:hypothetical protein